MGIINDIKSSFFGDIEAPELNEVEKIQYVEDLVRECIVDMAYSRDPIYVKAVRKNTVIMVRPGEEHIKKFTSGEMENTYLSLPANIYEDVKDMSEFDQYHNMMDTMQLALAAGTYEETDDSGTTNVTEAELIQAASQAYEEETGIGLNVKKLIEIDDFGDATEVTEQIFAPKAFVGEKDEPDEDDEAASEAESSCSTGSPATSTGGDYSASVSMQEVDDSVKAEETKATHEFVTENSYSANYSAQSITDADQKVVKNIKDSTFYIKDHGYGSDHIIDAVTEAELMRQVNSIAKALKGYEGRVKRMTPAKRLSSKDICNDNSEKIYIGKSMTDGKFIDQSVLVDCSGSMGGDPIADAIKMCFVFNKLAQMDLLEGDIILTETSENMKITMPVHDDVIKSLGGTGGGEGLAKTIHKHANDVRGKNLLVMTDGDLVEEPIPEKFWDKHRITCLGMYINRSVPAESLPGYDKQMGRWFPKTIIRNNFEDAVEKMVALGMRASKKA